jgi:hypothetical protein
MNHPEFNVALIVDSEIVPKHVHELVQWSKLQSNLKISHIIVQPAGQADKRIHNAASLSGAGKLIGQVRETLFALLIKAENQLLSRSLLFKDHLKIYDLRKELLHSVRVNPVISAPGLEYRYTDQDVSKIRSLNLDLIIHCGSGTLRGEVLQSSTFGIVSCYYGDDRLKRAGPPGFWEVYFREDATGFTIRRLTEETDSDKVLVKGQFPTKFFYLLNQASLYKKSNAHLKQLIAQVASTRSLPAQGQSGSCFNKLSETPSLAVQIKYTYDRNAAIAYKLVTRLLLKRYYRWGFAFSRNDWKNTVMGQSNRVKNPPNHFLADPFVIRERERDFCFVEDYDYGRKKGCISVYELKGNSAEPLGEAIVEPFHMSFPYLFRFQGKLYMCPETNEAKQIRLYECTNFPLEWRLSKILMENISAVDTMIFEKGGVWWMFTNIDPANADDNCSELFIFSTDDPINGSWTPHPKNPVVIDSSKARNAGLLFDHDAIYRVAQKQAFDLYGHGFSINKILILSKDQYVETQVRAVSANFFSDLKGTHHMHSNGNVSVFDYLRHTAVSN